MSRCALLFVCVFALLVGVSCNSSSPQTVQPAPIVVHVSGAFANVSVGGAPVTLMASVAGAPASSPGVVWTLSIANTPCSPACGTLKWQTGGTSSLTAVYTPPTAAPSANNTATITATSTASARDVFVFNFQIFPAITVAIAPKFASQTAGGAAVSLSATVTNDFANAGVTWTLTAGGQACSPACGTITPGPAPVLTAQYTPPAAPPSGAADNPTITATSVTDPAISDNFSFTIAAPPISVAIINKFTSQSVGAPAVVVNATIQNDFTNAGLAWTLTAGGSACSPACGTLTPAAAPSLSASYTPPTTLPTGAGANPTITATSAADMTKSDSFSFTIVTPSSIFNGSYALLLRGFDSTGNPLALAGAIASNGAGNITAGELDLNDNGAFTHVGSISGSYTLDTSFNGIARVSITLIAGSGTVVLDATLSNDGKRGRVIEIDGSHSLVSGTLLQQDPAALAAANPAGSYAFGVDSDAGSTGGVTGRIVEAGQFVLGAGGTSVTSGVADAGQAGASAAIFGSPLGTAASLDPASTATAPDASGRGTVTLSFAGNATQYAYYIVNANQLNLMEIDAGGSLQTLQSGTAHLQTGLTANSINATSVVALTGVNNSNTATYVILGVLSIANGSDSAVTYDFNNGTTMPGVGLATNGQLRFPFDPTTGRSVLVNTPTIATSFVGAAIIYSYGTGQGYLIDVTPNNGAGALNHGFSGMLTPQGAGPFSIGNQLTGNCIGGAGGSAKPTIPNIDFALTLAGGAAPASYSGVIDLTTSDTSVGSGGQVSAVPINNLYIVDDANIGRGRMGFTGGVFGNFSDPNTDVASIYIIGPNQFVAIEQSGAGPSGIIFFDPQ